MQARHPSVSSFAHRILQGTNNVGKSVLLRPIDKQEGRDLNQDIALAKSYVSKI